METVKRNYNTKDVDMLVTIETIIDSAIANREFLQSKRSTWADPFFQDLKQQINQVGQDYLGQDNAKQLRLATQTVLEIMQPALKDLTEVKIQIEQDFKNTPSRRSEILNQLGYTNHFKQAQKKDQEALINLLYQFKNNLTAELKEEIADKGTSPETLETIKSYAETLKNADVSQEGFKSTRPELTAEAITALNEVYDKAISISKIASNFLKDNKAKKEQFSFNKVSKKLNLIKNTNQNP
ncbi:MAG: hypothetical protein DCF13_04690 [Flavobacteriaceae bacterium]|nr:MAG: hypothetical protein DCF13_04690 [Flavobacteriaceae bacterium]